MKLLVEAGSWFLKGDRGVYPMWGLPHIVNKKYHKKIVDKNLKEGNKGG
jgi:hypothetical protein